MKERHGQYVSNIGLHQLSNVYVKTKIPTMQCCLHCNALGLAVRVEIPPGLASHCPTKHRISDSTARENTGNEDRRY